jgi:hypothetical protein
MKPGILSLGLLLNGFVQGQFAPAAGKLGSTAIKSDSSCITSWASSAQFHAGYIQISHKDSGSVGPGDLQTVKGKALSNGVLSLGDSGIVTLFFESGIVNDEGFDFVVFENAFNDSFLELAHVEISENGRDFYRFPSISLTQTDIQTGAFGATYPENLHNLAGKYRIPYGTPFDIEELRESFDTLPSRFFYVRLIDVVGSIDPKWGSRDSKGNLINDPWPTPFPSCGFDLDAIGVIHPLHSATNRMNSLQVFQVFPRENQLQIKSSRAIGEVQVIQSNGKIVFYERNCLEYSLEIELSSSGLYWLKVGQIEQLYWVP